MTPREGIFDKNSAGRFRWVFHGQLFKLTNALAILALAILWIAVSVVISADRQREIDRVKVDLVGFARLFAEHSAFGFQAAARLADHVAHEYAANDVRPPKSMVHRFMVGAEHLVQLAIADAAGNVVFSSLGPSLTSIADREHFKVHVEKDLNRAFISAPVLGRVSNKWTVQVTRRVNGPAGEFRGVVVVSVDPDYYANVYSHLDLGRQSVVSSVGIDGIVRSRRVDGQQTTAGQRVADSALVQNMLVNALGAGAEVSVVDGLPRIYGFARVPGFDLTMVVGRWTDDVLADFYARRRLFLIFTALLSISIIVSAGFIWTALRRQDILLRDLQQANERGKAVQELRTRFVAMMSHEINTPLTGVLGFSELLFHSPIEPTLRDYARESHTAAKQIKDIVNDIMEIHRADEATANWGAAQVLIPELFRKVETRFASEAQAKQLAMSFHSDPDIPPVLVDEIRLAKALGHLVENAIRYTPAGEVSVHARLVSSWVEIEVADTGPGISEETQATLFEPFVQGRQVATAEGGGMGLGLAYAKMAAELMGGTLRLIESSSEGTVFHLTIRIESVLRAQPPLDSSPASA